MDEEGGAQQPLHQRLSGFRAVATLTVVLAAAFFMTYGNATTIAPNWVNTTGGDLAEVGSLDGGGDAVVVNDDVNLTGGTRLSLFNSGGASHGTLKDWSDRFELMSENDILFRSGGTTPSSGTERVRIKDGGSIRVTNGPLDMNNGDIDDVNKVDSDQFTTVHNTSLAAVDEAIDTYDRVKLLPQTYSGDTSITVSANNRDHVALHFEGAKIDYTGTGTAINITDTSSTDKVSIIGGALYGPTSGDTNYQGTTGVYFEDDGQNTIKLHYLKGFEHGIKGRNVDQWSEGSNIIIEGSHQQNHTLHFEGASSTGGSGTDSFRTTTIRGKHLHVIEGGTLLYQDQASLYDSDIKLSGFIPQGGSGWHLDGKLHESVVRLDIEGDGDGVIVGSNYNEGGIFLNPVIREGTGSNQSYVNPNDKRLPIMDNDGSGQIQFDNRILADSLGKLSSNENITVAAPLDVGDVNDIANARWDVPNSNANDNKIRVSGASDQFRMVPVVNGTSKWPKSLRYDYGEENWRIGYGDFKIDDGELDATNNPIKNIDLLDFKNESVQPIRFHSDDGEFRIEDMKTGSAQTVLRIPSTDTVEVEGNVTVNGGNRLNLWDSGDSNLGLLKNFADRLEMMSENDILFRTGGASAGGGGTERIRIKDGGSIRITNGPIDMNTGDITGIQYTNHTEQSGNLQTCDDGMAGATGYNASGHWGCHDGSWNKLY